MSWGEAFKMKGMTRKADDQDMVSKKVEGGGKAEGGHQSKVMHTAEDEAGGQGEAGHQGKVKQGGPRSRKLTKSRVVTRRRMVMNQLREKVCLKVRMQATRRSSQCLMMRRLPRRMAGWSQRVTKLASRMLRRCQWVRRLGRSKGASWWQQVLLLVQGQDL